MLETFVKPAISVLAHFKVTARCSHMLSMVHRERVTFYDASYIAAAESEEAVLVTQDEKLCTAAGKFVRALAYTGLKNRLIEGAQPKSLTKETRMNGIA